MSAAQSARPKAPSVARERLIHVIQGEFAIVDQPDAILTTLLGSCVAVCMRDPVSGVGGMNHFLLPGDASSGNESVKYGVNAMELLVNGLLQRGGLRSRLEAKLFGGGHVITSATAIGQKNAEFAKRFLDAEGIRCVGESLGGEKARRIRYWPSTGRASQLLLDSSTPEVVKADRPKPKPPTDADAGAVELF